VLDSPMLTAEHEAFWFSDHLGYAALIPSFFRRYQLVQSIVWDRDQLGMGAYFRKQTEFVIYGRKHGAAEFTSTSERDLVRMRPTVGDKQHPAQKPVALLGKLLAPTSATCVLDPFCGSGSTLIAARALGRKGIGIEIEERYCEIAAKRLSAGNLELFGEQSA
jgi:DNA modification methylase